MNKSITKAVLTMVIILTSTVVLAQTQQGYVKTKGRMVNGQLVPGQGLKGATVSIKGHTAVLVNSNDGAFSFPVTESQFHLDSVNKKGYQLVDMDVCPKTYKQSPNPLYIVMETPEQQLQDKLNAERKIRRNLQKQLQAKEDEIEALKAENKISLEEYQKAMLQIYAELENNEQLISDMAKRYSEIDYDQLDEFYRNVSYCIVNGELVKADSLLRSRGDIKAQVNIIMQRGQALQEEKEKLQHAETVQKADIDEAAQRCYSFYEAFLVQHLNDSAVYYIELRAKLDTTNIEWQNDAGNFIQDYLSDYDKALKYYETALRLVIQKGNDYDNVLNCYSNLSTIYIDLGLFEKSEEFINKSIELINKGVCSNYKNISESYSNLAALQYYFGDYGKSIENYNKVLQIQLKYLGERDINIATTYNNLGFVYSCAGEYDKALENLDKALEIWKSSYGEIHPDVALAYSNLGNVYSSDFYIGRDIDKCMEYYQKALEIRRSVFGEMHPDVAISYGTVGSAYSLKDDYDTALEYKFKALRINKTLFGEDYYDLAYDYNNVGRDYMRMGDSDKALEYYQKSTELILSNFGEMHPDLADVYKNIASTYRSIKEHDKAIEYDEKALKISELTYDESNMSLIETINYLGLDYYSKGNYDKALEYFERAYSLCKKVRGDDDTLTQAYKANIEHAKENLKK